MRLSPTQLRKFAECPAAWHAQYVLKSYRPIETDAMRLGTLFHYAMANPLMDHPQLLVKAGELGLLTQSNKLAKPAQMVLRAAHHLLGLQDSGIHAMVHADDALRELELSGTFGGVEMVGHIDLYVPSAGVFVDYKTVSDITEGAWMRGQGKVRYGWVQGYLQQMAIYRELVRQCYGVLATPVILGVEKPDDNHPTPNVLAFPWQQDDQGVEAELDRAVTLISMELLPAAEGSQQECRRCEACEWCAKSRTAYVVPIKRLHQEGPTWIR